MLSGAADGGDRAAEIADVVEGIEDAEHVHAVLGRFIDEAIDDGILIVAVAEQVLAAQQHLEAAVGQELAELAQTLPRVLVEETDTRIEGGASPALDRPITRLLDIGACGNH